jgi:hypothetical protein
MARLIDAAQEIVSFLRGQGWPCCIVGGLAVPAWGEPRATVDVDVCLYTGLGDEQSFIDLILKRFTPRISDAREFAERNRVILIHASNGIGVDIALAWTPFESTMLYRARPFEFTADIALPIASAEDVVIMKAFAGRPHDWVDLRGVLVKQRDKLDWSYIERELTALCELKEAPEILIQLQHIREQVDAQ